MSLEALISSAFSIIEPEKLENAIITNDMLISDEVVKTLLIYLNPQTDEFLDKLISIMDETTVENVLEYIAIQNEEVFQSLVILSEEGEDIGKYFEKFIQTYKNLLIKLINIIKVKRHGKK